MNIVFVSNFFNHHQKEVADRLYELTDGGYRFLGLTEVPEDRLKMGYLQGDFPAYVVRREKDITELPDVLIAGSDSSLNRKVLARSRSVVFRATERPMKYGNSLWKKAYRYFKYRLDNPKEMYLLCSGAYVAADYSRFGLFRNRAFKWGYFPETRKYLTEELFRQKKVNELFWCGRFLYWKHPDDAIRVAKFLKDAGYSFRLNMVGSGEMSGTLEEMVSAYDLTEYVTFWGNRKPTEVRNFMERAGIYLFTSDRKEGWGAVLNEAMNSGCAVVASHAAGAVPYLMKNGENGLVYRSGNIDELTERVKHLLDVPENQQRLGLAAYHTITELWNGRVAAERLIRLSEAIIDGGISLPLYEDGPCSKAEIINDDWINGIRT